METRLNTLVDVMRVPLTGDPASALVDTRRRNSAQDVACDVLIVGGGTGGVAAALAAGRMGCRVCLIEETDWIGGQLTAQGISALDEHEHIETFGGTASYYRLRTMIRDHYQRLGVGNAQADPFNPGNCWVTRLAFEPKVALASINEMLRPAVEAGQIRIFLRAKIAAATVEKDAITSVEIASLVSPESWRFRPAMVIDATELGDVLPLVGAEYRVGAETVEETGEPHAQPKIPMPHCVQSFTYVFALERLPKGESHAISRPARYDYFRSSQPYSLTIEVHGGEIYGEESGWLSYRVFDRLPGTKGGLWTYRRLVEATPKLPDYRADITMINWPGNDYREQSVIDQEPEVMAAALQDAKYASLGFLHWLQTEAPAEGDRLGAPELKLRPDVMGTSDGLCKYPYIREARRIRALKTITEQEVSANYQKGARAAHFEDSVGIGWYPIDIHRAGPDDVGVSCRTQPFQIPLGALIPMRMRNLIAASKNIGTTHITNGCYRLHPVEWNIGEAAGALAAFAIKRNVDPAAVRSAPASLREFQDLLLSEGVPLAWAIDVPLGHADFATVQRAMIAQPPGDQSSLAFNAKTATRSTQGSVG